MILYRVVDRKGQGKGGPLKDSVETESIRKIFLVMLVNSNWDDTVTMYQVS